MTLTNMHMTIQKVVDVRRPSTCAEIRKWGSARHTRFFESLMSFVREAVTTRALVVSRCGSLSRVADAPEGCAAAAGPNKVRQGSCTRTILNF